MVDYIKHLHVNGTQIIGTPHLYTCTQFILFTVSEMYNVQQLHILTLSSMQCSTLVPTRLYKILLCIQLISLKKYSTLNFYKISFSVKIYMWSKWQTDSGYSQYSYSLALIFMIWTNKTITDCGIMNHYCVLAFTLMFYETHNVTYYSVTLFVHTQFSNTDCNTQYMSTMDGSGRI